MSLLQSIFMGLIQGLTEFLPVSSSGHLALFKALFHVQTDTGIMFDVLLHLGTLVAVFAVYYKDIWELICEGVSIVIEFLLSCQCWHRDRQSFFFQEQEVPQDGGYTIPPFCHADHCLYHPYRYHGCFGPESD